MAFTETHYICMQHNRNLNLDIFQKWKSYELKFAEQNKLHHDSSDSDNSEHSSNPRSIRSNRTDLAVDCPCTDLDGCCMNPLCHIHYIDKDDVRKSCPYTNNVEGLKFDEIEIESLCMNNMCFLHYDEDHKRFGFPSNSTDPPEWDTEPESENPEPESEDSEWELISECRRLDLNADEIAAKC